MAPVAGLGGHGFSEANTKVVFSGLGGPEWGSVAMGFQCWVATLVSAGEGFTLFIPGRAEEASEVRRRRLYFQKGTTKGDIAKRGCPVKDIERPEGSSIPLDKEARTPRNEKIARKLNFENTPHLLARF